MGKSPVDFVESLDCCFQLSAQVVWSGSSPSSLWKMADDGIAQNGTALALNMLSGGGRPSLGGGGGGGDFGSAGGARPKGDCRAWVASGECSFGDRCRFAHDPKKKGPVAQAVVMTRTCWSGGSAGRHQDRGARRRKPQDFPASTLAAKAPVFGRPIAGRRTGRGERSPWLVPAFVES